MLLHSLKALNFKKFREVNLQDLPTRGLVGVLGPNEGGKSSLVDAITFVLFGRTPGADVAGLESLIHWEEEVCQVEIVFGLADGSTYRLFREIDRMGDHLTQLERLGDGATQGEDLVQAMASLTMDDAASERQVSGNLRVERELQQLLGYTYEDFRSSFYLAQAGDDQLGRVKLTRATPGDDTARMATAAAGVPDWSGVLFRMTGIDALERAIQRAAGVAESIQHESRQVEMELETQGRVMAALGVEQEDESTLERAVVELGSDIAAADGAHLAARRDLERARTGIVQRATAARELGGLALAVLRARVASRVGSLATGLVNRRTQLGNQRAAAAGECETARRRFDGAGELRRSLEDLERRVGERRQELDSWLGTGSPDSLIDQRDALLRQVSGLHGGGRVLIRLAVLLLILAAAAAGMLLAQNTAAVQLPFIIAAGQLQGGGIGLAVVGLVLLLVGLLRRSRSRQQLVARQVALEEIEQRIKQSTSEREILAQDVLEIARTPAAGHSGDERLRELVQVIGLENQGFLDRRVTLDEYVAELKHTVDEVEVRLRHFDATSERLGHLQQSAGNLAADLAPFARQETAAEPIADVDLGALEEALAELKQRAADLGRRLEGDDRLLTDRLTTLHEIIDTFGGVAGERLQELDAGLHAGQSTDETDHHLVTKIDGVLDALPGEEELQQEVERIAAHGEEQERRLTELRTRREERQAELSRLKPQFERRRTVAEEIQALMSKAADLAAELEREQTAGRLLQGTADQLRSRLAPTLGRSLGRRLGRITGGRYSRVSVDLDFGIHIYSDDRNGFIAPAELSGGTHDQLLLALRLAFAEVLLASRGRAVGPHLLLLDEPFESFDAERARNLLALLREGDGALTQVILLANQEQVAEDCDLTIRTTVAGETLVAGGTSAPASPMPSNFRLD